MAVLCGMPTIQYSVESARLYLIRGSLGPLESSTQNGISLASVVLQGSLGDRPTDHATQSETIGGIFVHSTVMWSNNNCSIRGLLDWFFMLLSSNVQNKAIVDSRLCFVHSVESHAGLYTSLI